jgi:hypothetical protein
MSERIHAGLKPRIHNVCGWDTCGGGPSGPRNIAHDR